MTHYVEYSGNLYEFIGINHGIFVFIGVIDGEPLTFKLERCEVPEYLNQIVRSE